MKRLILTSLVITINVTLAQYKTLTVYYSGDSTKVVNLANTDSLIIFICGSSKVNYGGQAYNTVLIGDQCWLKENLNIGTFIQGTSSQANNQVIEKYCYNNLESNCSTYGGLYQWDEAMQYVETEGSKGICPDGWHIPTRTQFQTLATSVGNDGHSLKDIGQGSGINTSGFSALLAGKRITSGAYQYLNSMVYFWNSTSQFNSPGYVALWDSNSSIFIGSSDRAYGYSIRCLKD